MPTKTDRILSYLPGTFRALPKPTALHSTVDAFGNELQQAENSLAAVMISHWVDHADRGADLIQDLACIASLYGLLPRGANPAKLLKKDSSTCPPTPADETVEEFRGHLKRYVRTFLEGTVTVQGILRVTAEALGLQIKDDYDELDTWWTRSDDSLTNVVPRGDDAADLLFGVAAVDIAGNVALPAQIIGSAILPDPIELGSNAKLLLSVDEEPAVEIALPANASLAQLIETINAALAAKNPNHGQVASIAGGKLMLTSPTIGANSHLEAADIEGDAAARLFGLPVRVYRGSPATKAVVNSLELGNAIDLSQLRFLRLIVDGKHQSEIDCAGPNPAQTKPEEIAQAINNALKPEIGADMATVNGGKLVLTSPSAGIDSRIVFSPAPAQDARELLFGSIPTFNSGTDPSRARVTGTRDLSAGIDLSKRSRLLIRVDSQPAVSVDVAGANPPLTTPAEIAAALNARLGVNFASIDGRFISLSSPTTGANSLIGFDTLPTDESEQDATEIIFGIGKRAFSGANATAARLAGSRDLSKGANLSALHALRLGMDGGESVEIDAASVAADRTRAMLPEITEAINKAVGSTVASDDGKHLIISSPKTGSESRILIQPIEIIRHQRFVTRAFTEDEASARIFGFLKSQSQGLASTFAAVIGQPDLSRGVDLSQTRLLRLTVSGKTEEVDCAGPRPRLTLLEEIAERINQKFKDYLHAESADGKRLTLTALNAGAANQIAFEPPRGALQTIFGNGPQNSRGKAANGVNLVGLIDLSNGVELPGDGLIKISVNGKEAVQIPCVLSLVPTTTTPAEDDGTDASDSVTPKKTKVTLDQIVIAINGRLGQTVATHDGKHLVLISAAGPESAIRLETPTADDSTETIFGIKTPREYKGVSATPARITSPVLPASLNLQAGRTLAISVNGGQAIEIDCATNAANVQAVTPAEIENNIRAALQNAAAQASVKLQDGKLVLETTTTGATAQINLAAFTGDDAREKLFGKDPKITLGGDPVPATIKGETDLNSPVNLSERSTIRLAVDGGRTIEVDVAGSAPQSTTIDEIVARINAVFPNLASVTDDQRLLLTSPTSGENSSLELSPTRWLELIEYPPTPVSSPPTAEPPSQIRHGGRFALNNDGAAETPLLIDLFAPSGVASPSFTNLTTDAMIKLNVMVQAGERVNLWAETDGTIRAKLTAIDGSSRELKPAEIIAKDPSVMILPQGVSQWIFMDCNGARFNRSRFTTDPRHPTRFAGGICIERGIFNISHFNSDPPSLDDTVFASSLAEPDPPIEFRFRWMQFQPGAFTVNLPADLPDRFGGRFNQARFGSAADLIETYRNVVTEPDNDPDNLVKLINEKSKLVTADVVTSQNPELGFTAVILPIRRPKERHLQGGKSTEPARIYLKEDDVPGFIRLTAKEKGVQGNAIVITAQKAGPARYDVTVSFQGARFESARQIVRGAESTQVEALLKPGPVGILQAKAAGVSADVTRDGAESPG